MLLTSESQFEILSAFVPPKSIDTLKEICLQYPFELKINKKRATKLGDYRPAEYGKGHRISINHDLNQYAFLLTLVHEIAHLVVYSSLARSVPHHGKEWKLAYRALLLPFMECRVFPEDIEASIGHFFRRLGQSNRSDIELNQVLKRYDQPNGLVLIQDLPQKSLFRAINGNVFRKGPKLRKRFRCKCLNNNRFYLVHALMEVYPVHYQYVLEFPE